MANIKRARESFTYWDEQGTPRDVPAGTLIDPDRMSGYKGREHLFEDVDVYVDRVEPKRTVETATADPGEKRSVSPTPSKYVSPLQRKTEGKKD